VTSDIYVYFIDIPGKVKEMVVPCHMGYTIYIDKKLDENQRIKAYRHAMKHINNNDWENTGSADIIEFHAHR